jgi:hypothetical protein
MITTPCNLDYLLSSVRLRVGDVSTPVQYSDALVRTALVNGVKAIGHYWGHRYFIYDPQMDRGADIETPFGVIPKPSGVQPYDALRNPTYQFVAAPPPIIDVRDEYPIVTAAALLCLRTRLTSNMITLISWQTPDFSYTPSVVVRQIGEQLKQLQDDLQSFFTQRLGKPVVFPL